MTESEFRALELKYETHIPYSNGYENGYADAEAHYLKLIEDIKAEIEERATYEGIYLDRADVLEIIDKKVNEVKHDCTACKHSDEVDGSNCYECVKGIKDNFEVNEVAT